VFKLKVPTSVSYGGPSSQLSNTSAAHLMKEQTVFESPQHMVDDIVKMAK
jgi:hypothetical protein